MKTFFIMHNFVKKSTLNIFDWKLFWHFPVGVCQKVDKDLDTTRDDSIKILKLLIIDYE